jgi:hypothetical protein
MIKEAHYLYYYLMGIIVKTYSRQCRFDAIYHTNNAASTLYWPPPPVNDFAALMIETAA